jgi:dTDP-4-amino-4,6-dideoxygalactose transaminase
MSRLIIEELSPVRDEMLIFGLPTLNETEIDEVVESLRSGWLGTGPKVARFEKEIASYKGLAQDQVAAVNSCTAALHLSLIVAGIGPGDEVLTTPMTFCATINAIIHCGATPVLVDIDPVTMNISPELIEENISPKTKAILPVHFAGRPCDMTSIMDIANKYGLKVIEDCAHAIETEWQGQKAGTIGDFGCFSFYVTKNLVTGEGGLVTARDNKQIERVKQLSLHGMSKDAWRRFGGEGYNHYQVLEPGYKYNMMDIQAAIGIHQLESLEKNWHRRQKIWETYQQAFSQLPITIPARIESNTRHAYHLYTLLINEEKAGIKRDDFLNGMTKQKIGVGVHYIGIFEYPYYQERFGWKPNDYPNAMKVGNETVSLPLTPYLSEKDVGDVIQAVNTLILDA